MTSAIVECFSNNVFITYLLIVSTAELNGARNNIWSLAKMLTRTLPIVVMSSDSETSEFLFNH